jgi:hypothetical protein
MVARLEPPNCEPQHNWTAFPSGGPLGKPVQKCRSIEDLERAPVLVRPEDGFDRFVRHCARYRQLVPRPYPRGVFRFRTIEEAQAARRNASRPENA